MFNFFKKKAKEPKIPALADLDNNPLQVGDEVVSLRYDLGNCKIVDSEDGIMYESLESGQKVIWLKMIDAATELQKVRKVIKEEDIS